MHPPKFNNFAPANMMGLEDDPSLSFWDVRADVQGEFTGKNFQGVIRTQFIKNQNIQIWILQNSSTQEFIEYFETQEEFIKFIKIFNFSAVQVTS